MKRLVYLFLTLILTQGQSFADKRSDKKPIKNPENKYTQIFSIYPARTFSNYMMLGYEKKISQQKAIKLVAGYTYFNNPDDVTGNRYIYNLRGFRGELQMKYFFSKEKPLFEGYYIAPTVGFKYSQFELPSLIFPTEFSKTSAQGMMVGVVVGYQFKLGKSFVGDIYAGEVIKKSFGDYSSVSSGLDAYSNAIGFHGGICIGFGF